MEIKLQFPDSCYNEDKENYDKFFNAIQLCLNRMAMSHNKYQNGRPMHEVVKFIDEIKSLLKRLSMYTTENWFTKELKAWLWDVEYMKKPLNTGNTENLLDAANMLLIEFIHPKHPKSKFKAQSTEQSPNLEYLENVD